MKASYLPVPWVYKEVIEEQIEKQAEGKVFYFGEENEVSSANGRIVKLYDLPGEGEFIKLVPEYDIRIDRIITLFGKPGAAYSEYEAYADACMDCMGGYTKEDLEKEWCSLLILISF